MGTSRIKLPETSFDRQIKTSFGRHFRTSPGHQIGTSPGRSNKIFRGHPGDVGGGRPPDILGTNICRLRTSIDGEDEFGKAATKTLQDTFHVDDLLKSLDNEKETIKLIKNVTAMCESGGFKLTKFLSNSKQVLQSIDEADRRQGVKDQDLMGDLPAERALAVLWDIGTDKFGFRLISKQKSWARRGLLSVISSVYDPLRFAIPFLLQGKLLIQQLCEENFG